MCSRSKAEDWINRQLGRMLVEGQLDKQMYHSTVKLGHRWYGIRLDDRQQGRCTILYLVRACSTGKDKQYIKGSGGSE